MIRFRLGILGATGLVGQRLVDRLRSHPWFEVCAVAASSRSAGRRYGDAVTWRLAQAPPAQVAALAVSPCEPAALAGCDVLLSALDAQTAREVEPRMRDAGFPVVSNSSAYRMAADVPLLVPEVNAAHLSLIGRQRDAAGGGFIVTNPNCSVIGLALGIAPLHRAFGVRRVVVTTLQAISGAGLSGPSALDLVDNVLPYIDGEEEKIERELQKILGTLDSGTASVRAAGIDVSAHCHRVAVQDGHLEAVSVELGRPVEPAEAEEVLRGFTGEEDVRRLPSAVAHPVEVRREPDRPQPRLDRDAAGGMAVVVGRVRRCPVLGLKFELLSHNAVRGAAGGTLLAAELLVERGFVGRRGS